MKATELRELSPAELNRKYAELKKDLFNLRMQHATNQLDNPIRIRDLKKDIARVITVIRANELAGKTEGSSAQLKEAAVK